MNNILSHLLDELIVWANWEKIQAKATFEKNHGSSRKAWMVKTSTFDVKGNTQVSNYMYTTNIVLCCLGQSALCLYGIINTS